ncbi:MAG: zf-HC2 domain-containing protein [Planctomycetota bacterium]
MNCETARPLVPLYIDGELTEPRASSLRPHLLECPDCRGVVQGAKALKTWFVPTQPVSVPDGFAARVARRAFAGDRGLAGESGREWVPAEWVPAAGARSHHETPILQFVLQAVAVAAVLLITLSIAIRRQELPDSEGLRALSGSGSSSLRALDALNRERELEVDGEIDDEVDAAGESGALDE